MIKINRKFEYSLMVLKAFSDKPDAQISAKSLSVSLGIPVDTTSKVMQILAREDILQSTQGTRGGYHLIKDLEKLNLYDLSLATQGEFSDLGCQNGGCQIQGHCNILEPINNLTNKLKTFFIQTNVKDLLEVK